MAFDTFLPFTFKPDNVNVSVCELSSTAVNYTIPAGYYALVTVNMSSNVHAGAAQDTSIEGNNATFINHAKHHSFQLWLGEGDTIHLVKNADQSNTGSYSSNQYLNYELEVDITPNGGARTNAHLIQNHIKTAPSGSTNLTTRLFLSAVTQEYALP